jgi:hypothetical protein
MYIPLPRFKFCQARVAASAPDGVASTQVNPWMQPGLDLWAQQDGGLDGLVNW